MTSAIRRRLAIGALAVVLVDLRQAVTHLVVDVEQLVIRGQFHELACGEDSLHLPPEGCVHAVVVVGVQEASRFQIGTQASRLPRGKGDVAMPRQVEERVAEQLLVGEPHAGFGVGGKHAGMGTDEGEQVRQRGRVAVPVAAAVVVHARDGEGLGGWLGGGGQGRQ